MRHRQLLALPFAAALVLTVALGASAKEQDARASLDTLLPRDATPGSTIDVAWSVFFVGTAQPFATDGMFIELTGPTGAVTKSMAHPTTDQTGRYRATIEVPAGGIAKVQMGMDMGRPIYFQRVGLTFEGLPLGAVATAAPDPAAAVASAPPPAAVQPQPATTGPDLGPAVLVGIAAAVIGAVAVAVGTRRRASFGRPA
jgi:hypothetical protein